MKETKPPKSRDHSGEQRECKCSGHIHVSGCIEANPPKGFIEACKTAYEEAHSKETTRNNIFDAAGIVILALALAASACQAYYTRKLVYEENRAWVGISGSGDFHIQLIENAPLVVTISGINSGKSPALGEKSVNKMQTIGKSLPQPTFNDYSEKEASAPATLLPNSLLNISPNSAGVAAQGSSMPRLTLTQIESFKSGAIRIYVYGTIWYYDTVAGRKHHTDYCFTYSPDTFYAAADGFITCDSHNYAD